ncbi:hypothetical protein VPH35_064086 [Triticum aestivum]
MAASAGWWKPTLLLCFFGAETIVFGILAEDRNPFFSSSGTIIGDGYARCRFPNLTSTMGGLSVVSLLLTILAGHLAVFYPYATNNTNQQPAAAVPLLALFRSTSLVVFFLVAELVSASALAMLYGATIRQTHVVNYLVLRLAYDGTIRCRSTVTTDGHFGGGALLAMEATLMWLLCQLLALEARANYLDGLNGDVNKDDGGNNKKYDRDHVDFTEYA